jgi:MFS family permease
MGGHAIQATTRGSVIGAGLIATELAVMFVGATLPTPLYTLYRHVFGFGGVTLTLIYAVYVLGNLSALLVFGRLSDQIGRRTVTLHNKPPGYSSLGC